MDTKIILAVAGSGKTYYIANEPDEKKRVFFLSFTHKNVQNIRDELLKRFNGKIPKNYIVLTFDAFLYNQFILPFKILLKPKVDINGVDTKSEPETDSRKPGYIKDCYSHHYVNSNNQIYINRQSKLILKQNQSIKTLMVTRLMKYCDLILIDEFQDYNGYDFKLLAWLLETSEINIIAVGDIFQSMVTPLRRNGLSIDKKPFYEVDSISRFRDVANLSSDLPIDKETLGLSRRVSTEVADYISCNLGIQIKGTKKDGKVIWVRQSKLDEILLDPKIIKLIWNKTLSINLIEPYVNWTYSKGDTYKDVCVILTNETSDLTAWSGLKPVVRNRLYVALTRSNRNVYLVKANDYKQWKEAKEEGNL